MTPAESAHLAAAYAFAAADRAEIAARTAYRLTQRAPAAPILEAVALLAELHAAQDATREARSAMVRAARNLPERESKFDIVGAP